MKKIILCVLLVLCLASCKAKDSNDYKSDLINYSSDLKEYSLKAVMSIMREEGETSFDIMVDYLEPNYYKVRLQNKSNNNIQVIVKNTDGVHVLTPGLNKQFTFNSDWPLNSSHAYLYQSIVKDISNDSGSSVLIDDNNYIISSTVNHKTNAKLKTQRVTFDKKTHKPISSVIFDSLEKPVIKVNFTSFNDKPGLKTTDFSVDTINNTIRLEMSEGTLSGVLLECIPTFIPDGYELDESTINEKYTVFTYAKDKNVYTISCSVVDIGKVLTPSREFSDAVLLDHSVGFVNNNSLSFFQDNLFVSIYNDNFNLEEAVLIANSFK